MQKIKIGNRVIGEGERVFIIAEAGVNHNGSMERAKELIVKAAQAGADAIKFQTYTADELVVKGTPKFWDDGSEKGKKDQYETYQETGGFPLENYPELIKYCEGNNIEFLSTPFSYEAADYLNSIGMKAFKVASSDMSTLPYLNHIAHFGKPILLSTGASTIEEIREAVNTIEKTGNKQIVILHCTLCYPTAPKDANFNLIQTIKKEFPEYLVGVSDHTLGILSSMVVAVMGASIIEKHFTADKTIPYPIDHRLAVDPADLKNLVGGLKFIDALKGSAEKRIFDCEKETREYDKRSIVSKIDIPAGAKITAEMITYKRPGTGIWPKNKDRIIGSIAKRTIKADTIFQWDDILQN